MASKNIGNIEGRVVLKDDTKRTLDRITRNIGSAIRTIARTTALLGTAALAGFGASIKMAMDFEKQMIEVSKVVEGFDENRRDIEDFAKTMSGRWAVGTTEVAEAMAFMGSMGADAFEIQRDLNDVMQMGIALNMSMSEAARMVASSQAIFAKEGLSAIEIADKLNSVTNQSAASTDFLSGALRMAGPAAAATGASMDNLLGVLVPLAEAGFQGSMAGRALNTIFPRLAQTTSEVTKGMQMLHDRGLSVNLEAMEGYADANPADQLLMLSRATRELDDDTKRQIATFIGGTQFFKQMFVLLEDGEGILEGTAYAVNSMGSAQEEAAKTTQSLAFRMRQMKQQIIFMGLDIGERLNPAMHGFLDNLESWIPNLKAAGMAAADFAVEVGGLLSNIVSGDWEGVQGNIDSLTEMFSGVGESIRTKITDVNWVGVFDSLYGVAEGIWGAIMAVAVPTGDQLIAWLNDVDWDAMWSSLQTNALNLWDTVMAIAVPTIEQLGAWLVDVDWGKLWDGFKSYVETLWDTLIKIAVPTMEQLVAWFQGVDWGLVFEGFGAWLADIGIWALDSIGDLTVALLEMVANTDWVQVGSDILGYLGDAIGGAIRGFYDKIFEWMAENEDEFQAGGGMGGGGGTSRGRAGMGKTFWDWLQNIIPGGQHGLSGTVNRPTLFMAGEGYQREHVQVTPGGMGGGVSVGVINMYGSDLGSGYGRRFASRSLIEQLGKDLKRRG